MNHREIRALLLKVQSEAAKRLAAIDARIEADGVKNVHQAYDAATVAEFLKDAFAGIDEAIDNLESVEV